MERLMMIFRAVMVLLFVLPAAPVMAATVITVGQMVNGSIDVAGERDEYQFDASAGQVLFFDRLEGSRLSINWELTAPSGAQVFWQGIWDDNGPVELSETGTYTLALTGNGNHTIAYRFQLVEVPPPSVAAIEIGQAIDGAIGVQGEVDNYSFTAQAGQVLFFDRLEGSRLSINWELTAPSGTQVFWQRNWDDNGPVELSESGLYTLRVDGNGDQILAYRFQVVEVPPPSVAAIEIGQVIDGAIGVQGEVDNYTFTAQAGQMLFFDRQEGGRLSINWELTAPSGAQVFWQRNWDDNGPIELSESGLYTLRVDGNGDQTLAYRFQIFDVPPPVITPIALDSIVHSVFSVPGQSEWFTFSAASGEMLSLETIAGGMPQFRWRLEGPDGAIVASSNLWMWNGSNGPLVLPVSGEYRLRVAGNGDATGSLGFRLWRVLPDRMQSIALDTPVSGVLTTLGERQSYLFEASAGQSISLDFQFNPGFVRFDLIAPDGSFVFRNKITDEVVAALPQDGTYRLVAHSRVGFHFNFQIASGQDPAPFPASADLVVSAVSAPVRVIGNPASVEVTWTVTNVGTVATDASAWVDAIEFRVQRDFVLGAVLNQTNLDTARVEARVEHSGILAPGASYTRTAVIEIDPDYQGAFEVAVVADARNDVFEGGNETNSAATGHLTAVYSAPRALEGAGVIDIELADGSVLPAGAEFNLSGQANLGGGTINVVAIIDISLSTNHSGGLDANGDGVADERDDLNGDGVVGSILDVEIGALLTIIKQLRERGNDVLMAVVPFDDVAANLDLGPGEYTQLFLNPGEHNELHLAASDLESAVRGLKVLTPIGTNFQDALRKAGQALESALPAEQTLVFFFTDGEAVTQPSSEEIDAFAAYGVRFHGYQIGNAQLTDSLSELVQGIDAHPASTGIGAPIENPNDLAPVVLNTLNLAAVEINGAPVAALDARGAFFTPVILAPGPNQFEIRAIATSGSEFAREITLIGATPGGVAQDRDIVSAGELEYYNTRYNRATGRLHVEARLINTGEFPNRAPVRAELAIQPPAVTLHNPDEQSAQGRPVIVFDDELGTGGLEPAATSAPIALKISNPRQDRFSMAADLLTTRNEAPVFTSVPVVLIEQGINYAYAASASDTDGDPLQFSLRMAPPGMTVDAASGVLSWPAAQLGTHRVQLVVDDGRGGSAVQDFALTVTSNLPDLAPVILSSPLVMAFSGSPYSYAVDAFDPEGQPLSFYLDGAPGDMRIDPVSGVISFDPATAAAGAYPLQVRVEDPAGNVGHQAWVLTVRGQDQNRPPNFVSEPVTQAVVGETYRYRAQALDEDEVTYSLVTAPVGMRIDPISGSISLNPQSAQLGGHTVVVRAEDPFGAFAEQAYWLEISADTQPPAVSVLLSSTVIELGSSVQVQLLAEDNIGVDATALAVEGEPAVLVNGIATITPSQSGLYTITGSATDAAGNYGEDAVSLRVIDPADDTGPTVVINSPASATRVNQPIDIVGTVQADDLEFWRLEYARLSQVGLDNIAAEGVNWRLLASGTQAVDNAVLATFDTTRLRDDAWVVRLLAQDFSGNQRVESVWMDVAAPAKLGQFALGYTDLSIPLAGIPITIERRYNTLDANEIGDFGYGWSLAFRQGNIRETVPVANNEAVAGLFVAWPYLYGTRVYIDTPEGQRVGFTFEPEAGPGLFGAAWRPRFVPDPGVFYELEVDNVTLQQRSDGSFALYLLGFNYNPSKFRLIAQDGTRYHYDQFRGLEKIEDRHGNFLSYTEDGIVHSSGVAVTFERDSEGRIVRVIDPEGKAITYGYDGRGNLISVTDRAGETTQFTYLDEPAHYVAEIIDARGERVNLLEYDADGRIAADIDALGHAVRMDWDLEAFTGTFTDAKGNVYLKQYDNQGRVIAETDPLGNKQFYSYDAHGNQTSVTDKNGHTTVMSYDDRGNLLSITDPLGNTVQYQYDAFGQITSVTDSQGRSAVASFDGQGNLIELELPDGTKAQMNYDLSGRPVSLTDFAGNTTQFEYDGALAQASRIIFPDGSVRSMEYNTFGQLTRLVDETGAVTVREYDANGRLLVMQDAEGNRTRFEYAGGGLLVRRIDPLGNARLASYDANGLLASLTRADGGVIRFERDANGNLIRLTDPEGNSTRFVYDALNRLVERIDPLGASSTWEYDAQGNVIRQSDRNGRMREHDYDAMNRVVATRWFDASGVLTNTIRYGYDARGNQTFIEDDFSTLSFSYDARNRITSVTSSGPGIPQVTLSYEYDANGNRILVSDDQGEMAQSVYDALNRLQARSWQGGDGAARIELNYDSRGQRTELARFGDAHGAMPAGRSLYAWDRAGRLTGLSHEDNANAVIAEFDSVYDAASRLIAQTHHGQDFSYSYDEEGQLILAERSLFGTESFSYDLNGNRIGAGYVIGPGNRLLSDGNYDYEYDAEGNRIRRTHIASGAQDQYVWDARNRLIGIQRYDEHGVLVRDIRYTYDAMDRRIRTDVNGQANYTVYDGENAWADYDDAGNRLARYAFGDGTDEIIARIESGGQFWHLSDRLGTVYDLVDSAGNVINQIEYDSFGAVRFQSNAALGDRYLFTGREYDIDSEQYYYRARYYDPAAGRFLSEDPIGFDGGDANLYRYVGNSPQNAIDPSGKSAVEYALVMCSGLDQIDALKPVILCTERMYNAIQYSVENLVGQSDIGQRWLQCVMQGMAEGAGGDAAGNLFGEIDDSGGFEQGEAGDIIEQMEEGCSLLEDL